MRQALLVALLALALAGAGCTGDDAASTTTTTTLPPLVDSYPRGYGFRLGAADQTTGLFVEFTDFQAGMRGDIPEVSVLPDPMWNVQVRIGSDLFINWGKSVILASDPVPLVDEVWPVVAGTITILELPGTEECGIARARFEGFAAAAPDGTLVHLGDFEVENRSWGCFVG
jgi:hypothetical protein